MSALDYLRESQKQLGEARRLLREALGLELFVEVYDGRAFDKPRIKSLMAEIRSFLSGESQDTGERG